MHDDQQQPPSRGDGDGSGGDTHADDTTDRQATGGTAGNDNIGGTNPSSGSGSPDANANSLAWPRADADAEGNEVCVCTWQGRDDA